MSSRRHYTEQIRHLLKVGAQAGLVRAVNIPDARLTPAELEFRRKVEALREKHFLKKLSHLRRLAKRETAS